MNAKRPMRWISLAVLVLFALAQATPALAASDTINLKFINKTGVDLVVTMLGPARYIWDVPAGAVHYRVKEGTYTYQYEAFGVRRSGTIEVNKDNDELKLERLTGFLEVTNPTGDYVHMHLNGAKLYVFDLKPGLNKLEVLIGDYRYEYWSCEYSLNGQVEVKAVGTKNIKVKGCTTEVNNKTHAKIVFDNKTRLPIRIHLMGPAHYSFTVEPGRHKFDVVEGQYHYDAAGCRGGWVTGNVNIIEQLFWDWECSDF